MQSFQTLRQLGWQPFFQQQLSFEELESTLIGRITAHHRSEYRIHNGESEFALAIRPNTPNLTVGDWVLLDSDNTLHRELDRSSLFRRKAAGEGIDEQLIAANVDTLFIVVSLNDDLNVNRIERYLALAHEAQVTSVIVTTKLDLVTDSDYQEVLDQLDKSLEVISVNGLDKDSCEPLFQWCGLGQTVALVGSSGVGKSTLVNTLLGSDDQLTGGIREDDSKGRHTTTSRSIHFIDEGGALIDTPGMRELQLAFCDSGLDEVFSDIRELAETCRFADCQHVNEPGCAVKAAVESGELSQRKLNNFYKLKREELHNTETLHAKRARSKALHKTYKHAKVKRATR